MVFYMLSDEEKRRRKKEYNKKYNLRKKIERKAYWQEWYALNKHTFEYKKKKSDNQKKIRYELKKTVIGYYSNNTFSCSQCGFNDLRALHIDHINNNGSTHRKKFGGRGGSVIYADLKRQNFPTGYQVLCANCNNIKQWIEGKYGL